MGHEQCKKRKCQTWCTIMRPAKKYLTPRSPVVPSFMTEPQHTAEHAQVHDGTFQYPHLSLSIYIRHVYGYTYICLHINIPRCPAHSFDTLAHTQISKKWALAIRHIHTCIRTLQKTHPRTLHPEQSAAVWRSKERTSTTNDVTRKRI